MEPYGQSTFLSQPHPAGSLIKAEGAWGWITILSRFTQN